MKNKILVGFISAVSMGGLTGFSDLPETDVEDTKKYINIGGIEFRKAGAIYTDILWGGISKTDGVNTFSPKFLPVLNKEITSRKVTSAFNEQIKKVAYEAALKAGIEVVEGEISGTRSSESGSTGTYHVFTLFNINDYVAELNSDKNRKDLELLMRYKRPRVITSIATVFNRKSNIKINTTGNLVLKIKNPEIGSPELSIKREGSEEVVATLSDGTVFAYEYSRICWEKKNDIISVATIEVDRPGWDNSCPSGTKDNASKL